MSGSLTRSGMNKILQSSSNGDVLVTNDGATILKSIALGAPRNPATSLTAQTTQPPRFW